MKTIKQYLMLSLLITTIVPGLAAGQTQSSSNLEKSCRTFVQGFYDWYLAELKSDTTDAEQLAVKKYRFSAELVRQLNIDWTAQAKAKEGLVGLDFDPFINAQDFMPGYEAGKITMKGNNYLVEIMTVDPRTKERQLAVTPELSYTGGQWTFVNFHYGQYSQDGDLLSILAQLREERKKTPN